MGKQQVTPAAYSESQEERSRSIAKSQLCHEVRKQHLEGWEHRGGFADPTQQDKGAASQELTSPSPQSTGAKQGSLSRNSRGTKADSGQDRGEEGCITACALRDRAKE